ncbi:MAG TPA: outer membrane beta-barrel protein, partial [Bacteroidales bacterium]
MRVKLQLLLLFMSSCVILNAQNIRLSGKVVEVGTQKTLPGVGIIVFSSKDTTKKRLTSTDINGEFSISGLQSNSTYILRTSFLGFRELVKTFEAKTAPVSIGTLAIRQQSKLLDEVVVEGQKTPVVQKGDTTEMSASAYKVNVDATAQDLVQKMPGITVENGTVKAHGEEVKRVLVDGKNYFGEDASMALQNLPAEVVDKVQVYNKMSDQAEFTGFDDGNSSKVLNIVTRADRRKGENATATAGTDFSDKYLVTGRLNIFRGDKKITLLGGTNNINQQNFSTQDILGVMGGGSGGRGAYIGRQSGLNKPSMLGINYTNTLSKKVTISGSYFFNKQDNYTNTITSQENTVNFGDSISRPRNTYQVSNSTNVNFNHRFDMRLEYTIDSANSIIWAPRFSTQDNNRGSNSNQFSRNTLPDLIQFKADTSSNSSIGYNYANDLTFRHRFRKKGRTISLGTTVSGNLNNGDGQSYSLFQIINTPDSILDQRSDSKTYGNTFSSNLSYTEPIGKISLLQFSYNASFSKNNTDRKVYDNNSNLLDEKYSNVYSSEYNTQRAGVSYMIRGSENLFANAGVDYQLATLSGERTYPSRAKVDNRNFDNLLPNAMMNIKFSKKANLRLFYRASTNPPSVTQLQDVITKSGTYSYNQGNPNLEHEYTNNLRLNFRFSNPDKFTNFSFSVFGNYTANAIGTAIYYPSRDSIITSGTSSETITPLGTLTKPINFSNDWSATMFFNYGFLFMPIKCNLNFSGSASLSSNPGSVNNILNTTNQSVFNGRLTVASNISTNVDFLLSYTGTYTLANVTYQGDISEMKNKLSNPSNKTWNHGISLTSTITMWERLVFVNTVNEQLL